MSHILELKNLSFVYGQGTPFEKKAVDNLSATIEKGEFIGIIGHTGSGKSTLVQMLNGLMKPTSGQVLLDGRDIWTEPKKIREIRFRVGMVFQYPEYQLFEDTVYKDIAFGAKNKGLEGDALDKAVRKAAEFTGLKEELLDKSPFDLSGGEKRRAAIAGVMAMEPEVLILDEPTAGLDPMGREILLSQIVNYHKERGVTVLLVSHSMEDIARVADRIMVLNHGTLHDFDKTKSVFAKGDDLRKIGLKVPQITRIMQTLRERGTDVPDGVLTVDEALEVLSSKRRVRYGKRRSLRTVFPGKKSYAQARPAREACLFYSFCGVDFLHLQLRFPRSYRRLHDFYDSGERRIAEILLQESESDFVRGADNLGAQSLLRLG